MVVCISIDIVAHILFITVIKSSKYQQHVGYSEDEQELNIPELEKIHIQICMCFLPLTEIQKLPHQVKAVVYLISS